MFLCAYGPEYAGRQVSDLTRLEHLAAENQRLQQLAAELRLETHAIKEILRKSYCEKSNRPLPDARWATRWWRRANANIMPAKW